jgi:predicted DNA-binding protein (MmcQ/YjbR family)
MPARSRPGDALANQLRAFGLKYPGAHTKSPWPGHLDLAVNDKTFAYLPAPGEPFHIGCKLPHSASVALLLPFVKPAGYGLGKSGWVDATPGEKELPPAELFESWIDESYRAQAPKSLLKKLEAGAAVAANAPAKKPAVKTKRPAVASATKKKPAAPAKKKIAKAARAR